MLRKLAPYLLGSCLLLAPQPSYASPTDNNACKNALSACLDVNQKSADVIRLQKAQINACNKAEHDIESKCSPTSTTTLVVIGIGTFVLGILIEGLLHR
jgi:hypothetical protein